MRAGHRLGITIPLPGVPLCEHGEWLRRLVDRGYTDAWTMETAGLDAFTPLAAAAVLAPELRLGTAIASVFARGPALLAQSAAALAELAPGRFVLGLGSSSETMVRDWNGVPFERPFARVRDSLRFVRRALAGERIDEDFESFGCHGFRLDRVPAVPPPVYLAALRRDMLRLAGREADGVMLSLVGPEDVPKLLREVAAGGPRGASDVVLRVGVLPDRDAGRAREACRRLVAAYLTVPAYADMSRALGKDDLVEPVARAWRAGDRKAAVAAVPDALVDALFAHGPAEACRDQLEAFRAAGITTPVASILPGATGPQELVRVLEVLAAG